MGLATASQQVPKVFPHQPKHPTRSPGENITTRHRVNGHPAVPIASICQVVAAQQQIMLPGCTPHYKHSSEGMTGTLSLHQAMCPGAQCAFIQPSRLSPGVVECYPATRAQPIAVPKTSPPNLTPTAWRLPQQPTASHLPSTRVRLQPGRHHSPSPSAQGYRGR